MTNQTDEEAELVTAPHKRFAGFVGGFRLRSSQFPFHTVSITAVNFYHKLTSVQSLSARDLIVEREPQVTFLDCFTLRTLRPALGLLQRPRPRSRQLVVEQGVPSAGLNKSRLLRRFQERGRRGSRSKSKRRRRTGKGVPRTGACKQQPGRNPYRTEFVK